MALMRKSNREFTEEVFLRSENLISKKKAFRKKAVLSVAGIVLVVFVVPISFILGSASEENSVQSNDMNVGEYNQQECKDDDNNSNSAASIDQAEQEKHNPSETEKQENSGQMVSDEMPMSNSMTWDAETKTDAEEIGTEEIGTENTEAEMAADSWLDGEEDEDE